MNDFDFIPAEYHAHRSRRQANHLQASLVGLLIMMMVLWLTAHHHQVATASAMLRDVEEQREQVKIHQVRKDAMELEEARLRDRKRLLKELEQPASLVVVFGSVSRALPESVVLTKISLRCPSLSRFATTGQETSPTAAAKLVADSAVVKPAGGKTTENPDPHRSEIGPTLTMNGIASTTPDILRFTAALEASPLFDRVRMEDKGPITWAGRRGQSFVLTCDLADQRGDEGQTGPGDQGTKGSRD